MKTYKKSQNSMFLFGMRATALVTVLSLIVWWGSGTAEAVSIRSWDSANQRGGDLFNAGTGTLQYSAFEAALLAHGHTVLPGVSTLTTDNLSGVDVFFHGTGSRNLTTAEAAVISNFVMNGGRVIVEANSARSEQIAGNTVLAGLGLGNPFNGKTGGIQTPTGGTFTNNITATTVGPLGDLRGQTFGTSITADLNIGTGTLVGVNQSINALVEFQPYAGGGLVLAWGDPGGFNLFQQVGAKHYNPNNQAAYLNFIIPEPGTVLLVGLGGLALIRRRRR